MCIIKNKDSENGKEACQSNWLNYKTRENTNHCSGLSNRLFEEIATYRCNLSEMTHMSILLVEKLYHQGDDCVLSHRRD